MIQKFEKKINSQIVKGLAQIVDDKIWIHLNGETLCFDKQTSGGRRRGKAKGKEARSNLIHAPMPGKITKFFKKVGDSIASGESVFVMEAMKMEYTLKANMNGTIKKISYKELDQVNLGALIVEIDPLKES